MRIFIYRNAENPHFAEAAERLRAQLERCGVACDCAGDAEGYDAICAVGGDGTILDAGEVALARDLPIFGVNTGRVGFLAAFDEKDIPAIDEAAIRALYTSQRDVIALHGAKLEKPEIAINDIVFSKRDIAKTVELELSCDGKKLGVYRCDGLIVSTATGSTAYSLSAGGPVVLPDVPGIVITPICAYNTSQRSVVVPVGTEITVRMSARDEAALVTADGRTVAELGREEAAQVRRFSRRLKLLLSHERDVYELLSGTFKSGGA